MPADARAMPAPTKRGSFGCPRTPARCPRPLNVGSFGCPRMPAPRKRGSFGCPQMPAGWPHQRNVGLADARGCPRDARAHETWAFRMPADARAQETWVLRTPADRPMPARGRWMPAATKRGQHRCPHAADGCPRPRSVGKSDARTRCMGARAHDSWAKAMPAPAGWVRAPTKRVLKRCPHLADGCPRPRNVGTGDARTCPLGARAQETWAKTMARTAPSGRIFYGLISP